MLAVCSCVQSGLADARELRALSSAVSSHIDQLVRTNGYYTVYQFHTCVTAFGLNFSAAELFQIEVLVCNRKAAKREKGPDNPDTEALPRVKWLVWE